MSLINTAITGVRKEAVVLGAIRTDLLEFFQCETQGIRPEEARAIFLGLTEVSGTLVAVPTLYLLERVIQQKPPEIIAEEHLDWADKWNFWRRMDIEPMDRLLKEKSLISNLPWKQS